MTKEDKMAWGILQELIDSVPELELVPSERTKAELDEDNEDEKER